ncbi:MAG: transporter substrate-binding domain-containing protein [Pseudomonadota bacterium]
MRRLRSSSVVLTLLAALAATPILAVDLDAAEQAWLEARQGPVRVGIAEVPPLVIIDESGGQRGLAIDIYDELASRLPFEFAYRAYPNWAQLLEASRRGEIDVLFAAHETAERRERFDFTAPYAEVENRIIVRSDTDSAVDLALLRGREVLTTAGSAVDAYLREYHPAIRIRTVGSARELLRQLSRGRGDAGVLSSMRATHYINELEIENLRIAGDIDYGYSLGIAVRPDWPQLTAMLDRALAEIPASRRDALYLKWSLIPPPVTGQSALRLLAIGLIVLGGLTGMMLLWNRRLNAEIRRRAEVETRLSAANEALTEARLAAEQQARTDHLTGVPNRRSFFETLRMERNEAVRAETPLALVMLQLDGLDDINRIHGQLTGDDVLIEVARQLTDTLRADRYLGRLGGGRFGVILPDARLTEALALGETLRLAIEQFEAPVKGEPLRMTLSIGATAIWPPFSEVDTVERLLSRSDRALSRARSLGGNQVCSHQAAENLRVLEEPGDPVSGSAAGVAGYPGR